MSVEKAYPTDPRGLEDDGEYVPAKPCCTPMNTVPLSWCTKPDGHEPPCHADPVRPIELDDLGPGSAGRRRY